MHFDIITLFPQIIETYCSLSILGRAVSTGAISVNCHQLRDFGIGKHKKVDDRPFGGGIGQVLRPEPIFSCYENIKKYKKFKSIVLTPRGEKLSQKIIREKFSDQEQLIILCGRYEGIDQRAIDLFDYKISLGNYILTGGEIGALAIIDSVSRLVTGVFQKGLEVAQSDSFSDKNSCMAEEPQYTRPREFNNIRVPEVLLNGDHNKIHQWKLENKKYIN